MNYIKRQKDMTLKDEPPGQKVKGGKAENIY